MDKLCVIQADLDFAANVVRKMGCGAEHYDMIVGEAAAHRIASQAELAELLEALAFAERDYRQAHDLYGDGSRESGRAWDLMRRIGDKARATLSHTKGESK